MKHHRLSLFCLALVVSVGTMFAESGECGENVTWDLTNGVLTISGTGAMDDWEGLSGLPWASIRASIKSVVIENGVTSIGNCAFISCPFTSVTIPNSVTTIGSHAFYNCNKLPSIDIPDNVTLIGSYAFFKCSGFTSIEIPNGVTFIGDHTFEGCSGLTSFTISDKITKIGYSAFAGCTGLTSLVCEAVTPPQCNDKCFNEVNKDIPVYVPEGTVEVYQSKYIWKDFNNIKDVSILASGTCGAEGDNLTWVLKKVGILTISGTGEMKNWSTSEDPSWKPYNASITSVVIENGVTSIGDNAFDNCTELTSIVLPEGLLRVGNAFGGCVGLTTLTLPSTLTSLGAWAFYHCTGLTEIICKALNPPTCEKKSGMTPFVDVPTTTPLWVPKASVNLYKEAETWKRFKNNTYAFAANCADVNTIDGNSKAFLKPVSVAFVSGRYVYIQDETGTTMLYLNAVDEAIYAGAKITGIEGTTTIYYGLPEVKPANAVADWTITADGEEPYYQTITTVPTYDIINQWVKIENVSIEAEFTSSKSTEINLPMADGEIILRNQFRLEHSFSAEKRYDILAAVAFNNSTMKLYFLDVLAEHDKPQGIDDVPSDKVQSTKILRDGHIFILRDGKTYTVTGQAVK